MDDEPIARITGELSDKQSENPRDQEKIAEEQQDQEESYWNDVCNGFIRTVYAARSAYSKALMDADAQHNASRTKVDAELRASVEDGACPPLMLAYKGSVHAQKVMKLNDEYANESARAVTQFKNDVNAAAMYLAQRAINIVSAGQG